MKFEVEQMQKAIRESDSRYNHKAPMVTVTIPESDDFYIGTPITGKLTGYLWGDDECFDSEGFYQILTCPDGYLYKLYYSIPEDEDGVQEGLDCIDYSIAYKAVRCELRDDFDFESDRFDFLSDADLV